MKKILIFLLLLFSFGITYGNSTFVGDLSNTTDNTDSRYFNNNLESNTLTTSEQTQALKTAGLINEDGTLTPDGITAAGADASQCGNDCVDALMSKATEENSTTSSSSSSTDTSSSVSGETLAGYEFEIDVSSISPGIDITDKASTTSGRVNWLLGTVIQKMMVALGTFSILIMTIGGGYIILHNGQDELLSKGKSIFMSGIYAMIVALSSYYLIAIITYLLYS